LSHLLCLLLSILLTAAFIKGAGQQRSAEADNGTIQGIVTRSGNAEPISGVRIRLSGGPLDPTALRQLLNFFAASGVVVNLPANGLPDDKFLQTLTDAAAARGLSMTSLEARTAMLAFRSTNDSRYTATSDRDGRFTIKNVMPGRYTVQADREGYFGATSDSSTPSTATATVTAIAGKTADVAVSLSPGATISGRISANGESQFNTNVQAFSITYESGFQILQSRASKTTDDRGEYRLFFLPPGEYLVAVVPRQNPRPTIAAPGTASSSTGEQQVRTFYPNTVDAAAATPLVVRGGEEISGIDIAIRTESTYRISGEIRTSVPATAPTQLATPSLSATVGFVLHDPNTPDDSGGTSVGNVTLRPSGGGFSAPFEVSGVLPGFYDWRASVNESMPDGTVQPATGIVPFEVRNQDITGIVLDIHPTVQVTGTVTVDGHAPGNNSARVSLQVEGGSAKRPGYQTLAARVVTANSQDGSFTIPGVGIGRFRVMIGEGLAPDLYVEDVRQGPASVFDSGFDVGVEPPAGLHVLLRSGAGRIEGVVEDATKKPIVGVSVVLIPSEPRRQNRTLYRTATSDASGRYTIGGVTPGLYKLFAWPNIPSGAYFNSRFLDPYEEKGKTVNVGASSTMTVDLSAIPRNNP
jgi:hypothetical protein